MRFTVSESPSFAIAESPSSVGNIATGFDLLGHTIEGPRDRVRVQRTSEGVVRLRSVTGVLNELPDDPVKNTALRALQAFRAACGLKTGFEVDLVKGIPLGSGMGGSAASAVAAVVAANALLETPLRAIDLYPFALEGEAAASGSYHGDNVGPMLLGGVTLATADRLIRLPVPKGLTCVVVHPHLVVETRKAREALQASYAIGDFVPQSAGLAQMIVGLFTSNPDSLRAGLRDVLVEPRRAHLIPGFSEVKKAALDEGALGASISGGGPSVFAWFTERGAAERSAPSMQRAFGRVGLDADVFISPVDGPKAAVVE
jgi:homoserine kinase